MFTNSLQKPIAFFVDFIYNNDNQYQIDEFMKQKENNYG